ncbi:hypothetical protein O6H91_20G046700 [Diphasiastrum complanatum]|uniref:Uncharacterized protein n=1 Tax=Diphasiastrum complanatum TaxID=34168 RepID=A0ACC2AQ44_DIPCM|nr:hypothetical protein O6H91_20G046700 [Diphasiastrum complanatum]
MGFTEEELQQLQMENLQIDKAFVVPLEHRPKQQQQPPADDIPIIDLAPIARNDAIGLAKVVDEMGRAAEQWGFFQIVNHGVPLSLLDELETVATKFFHLPVHEKRRMQRSLQNPLGYYDGELTQNVRDWKEVFDFASGGKLELPAYSEPDRDEVDIYENKWPANPPEFRTVCEKWGAAVNLLAHQLLELLSQSLGLPADCLTTHFQNHMSFMRLNYYPKCPNPDLVLGVSRHKDVGALTVLVQDDVGGLEVRRKDGEWIRVTPHRDAFVINVGDLFQVWSNDKYHSVEHRVVVNAQKDRLSFPLFFNPYHNTNIAPMPELIDGQHPPKYRSFNYGKYFKKKGDGNYKDIGKDLQISDYAIEY